MSDSPADPGRYSRARAMREAVRLIFDHHDLPDRAMIARLLLDSYDNNKRTDRPEELLLQEATRAHATDALAHPLVTPAVAARSACAQVVAANLVDAADCAPILDLAYQLRIAWASGPGTAAAAIIDRALVAREAAIVAALQVIIRSSNV